ncbi:MAG: AsmA family protein [Candidatus Omnitrophica bacterium]|nr:AsmA family protein [Candidatus Omnitrophota bacterium]
MKKLITGALVVLVALVLIVGLGKNSIAKVVVEKAVKTITGLKLDIGKLDVGLVGTRVGVENLKLYNPGTFQDPVMVDLPEVLIDFDLSDLLAHKVHLEKVKLYLKELAIIKNRDGKLNLSYLKPEGAAARPESKEPTPAEPAGAKEGQPAKAPEIQIDELDLRIDKVVYKDYSKPGAPVTKEFKVGINETHYNITNPNAIVALLIGRAVMNTTISSLTDLGLGDIMSQFDMGGVDLGQLGLDRFGDMAGITSDLTNQAGSVLADAQKRLGSLQNDPKMAQAVSEVGKKAEEAAEELKSLFGGLTDQK